jgi:hypothetical protein
MGEMDSIEMVLKGIEGWNPLKKDFEHLICE